MAAMYPVETYYFIAAAFLLAGLVKGVVGLGFPTIILALLSLNLGVRDAMALMLLPCFLANVWQAVSGGYGRLLLRRLWPFLLMAVLSIWVTTGFLTGIDTGLLSCLLGLAVSSYGVFGLFTPKIAAPGKNERWLTPVLGVANGMVTGLTGTFVVPGVLYLQSLRLNKDALVQAMGILFLVSTTALAVGLTGQGLVGGDSLAVSAVAVLPSFLGMALGRKIRALLAERIYRRLFFVSILLLGLYILGHCLL